MELTLETLKAIIDGLPRDAPEDKNITIAIAIGNEETSNIDRIGFEIVYELDAEINCGILELRAFN